jgi:hypothetical protein
VRALRVNYVLNLIVGSLSGSRLKSVRFLVGESGVPVTRGVSGKIKSFIEFTIIIITTENRHLFD